MTPKTPRISTNSIPGKVFLLGEYAVLSGAPGLIASVSPRFSLSVAGGAAQATPFHPESPAGRLISEWKVQLDGKNIQFEDPFEGEGGFGGSTAEFALLVNALGVDDAFDAHREYRKLVDRGQKFPPSGADLIAQWKGGTHEVVPGKSTRELTREVSAFHWLLFSAGHLHGRKVPTHEHLAKLESRTADEFTSLTPALDLGLRALETADAIHLGQALTSFADRLADLGFEDAEAHGDRMAVLEVPGVLGAKGCGAMLADTFVVLCESEAAYAAATECLEGRGLRLVRQGLPSEDGIRAEGTP